MAIAPPLRTASAARCELQVRSANIRYAELESRLDRPEAAAKLTEIGFINRLIARKELSWTRLFANLEELVPNTVHLVSLTPSGEKALARMRAVAKRVDDEFFEPLDAAERKTLTVLLARLASHHDARYRQNGDS